MGAWGTGNLENDDALDWLGDFADEPSRDAIRKTLDRTLGPGEFEAPDAAGALAAAEVVAALHGKGTKTIQERLADWLNAQSSAAEDEIRRARVAIDRVRTASELAELWAESGELIAWNAALDELAARLDS